MKFPLLILLPLPNTPINPSSPPQEIPQHTTQEELKKKKSNYHCKKKITFYQNMASIDSEQGFFFFFFLHDIMTASTKGTATFLAFPIDSLCLCFAIYFTSGDTGYYSSQLLQNTLAIHPDKIPFLQLAGLPSPDSSSSSCSKSADSQLAFNAHH